jgi:hypothetical protein
MSGKFDKAAEQSAAVHNHCTHMRKNSRQSAFCRAKGKKKAAPLSADSFSLLFFISI